MQVERLDDLPILGALIKKANLSTLIDTHFPDHGHWRGISGGKLLTAWLIYILSEGDHRLSHVEDWAEQRLNTLRAVLEVKELRAVDFCDDRLGRLLDRLGEDEKWKVFEKAQARQLIQVYSLGVGKDEVQVIRSDSFNAPQHKSSEGLFQRGFSKQRRRDLPFCKIMMSVADPLALPLSVDIVKGSGPDYPHYLSVIERVQSSLGSQGNLYVGDSHMGSKSNRASIHRSSNYYLCPLNNKQVSKAQLHSYLGQIDKPFDKLDSLFTEPDSKRKSAHYYEVSEIVKSEESEQGSEQEWEERRILVHSPDYAEGLLQSLNKRLEKSETAMRDILVRKKGRKVVKSMSELENRLSAVLKKYKTQDCFRTDCELTIKNYTVQRHKERAEEVREDKTFHLHFERDEEVIAQKRKALAWQVYATNAPKEKISAADLVTNYRDEYKIEHLFDYLLNRDANLLPLYLKKESRIKGLIRLLMTAMQFSMLLQYEVRKSLRSTQRKLKGIYPGNKGRQTSLPTTPMLLRVFRGISSVFIKNGNEKSAQMTRLNEIQIEVLTLLKIPNLYQDIEVFLNTDFILRET